jgi:hypothetical protein
MKSTDYNINNPFKKVELDLLRTIPSWNILNILNITQEEYNLIQIHDPHTMYIISDSDTGKVYLGDILIEEDCTINKYYMGINDRKEYVVYVDQLAGTLDNRSQLVEICAYDNPQSAIDALYQFNKVGSHIKTDFDIYGIIKSYIEKNISTHELIISILVVYNFREDCRLQNIIEFAVSHNAHRCMKEFPSFYADQISRMRDNKPESLFPVYSNLYDLIVKYDFFSDRKYQNIDDLDLSSEIRDINKVIAFKSNEIEFN